MVWHAERERKIKDNQSRIFTRPRPPHHTHTIFIYRWWIVMYTDTTLSYARTLSLSLPTAIPCNKLARTNVLAEIERWAKKHTHI